MPGKPWIPKRFQDLLDIVGLISGANGKLLQWKSDGSGPQFTAVPDMLSVLQNTEISVTGAATAIMGTMHVCSGTSADYAVTLPAKVTRGLVAFRMDPGLTKLVTLTTGADVVAKTGTVTGGTSFNASGTGTVSTSGSSTTLTGSSTSFSTQLRVGDMLNMAGTIRRVVAIANNTSLTMDTAATVASTSFTYTQTGILGSSTQLSTDYTVGNGITINGITRKVTYVLNATVIAIDAPFPTAPSGASHGLTTNQIDGVYNRIMWSNESCLLYCDGTNWTKIGGKSIPMTASIGSSSVGTNVSIADSTLQKVVTDTLMFSSPAAMVDTTNKWVKVLRPGMYEINAKIQYTGNASSGTVNLIADAAVQIRAHLNGSLDKNAMQHAQSGQGFQYLSPFVYTNPVLNLNDTVELYAYRVTTSAQTIYLCNNATGANYLTLIETPMW